MSTVSFNLQLILLFVDIIFWCWCWSLFRINTSELECIYSRFGKVCRWEDVKIVHLVYWLDLNETSWEVEAPWPNIFSLEVLAHSLTIVWYPWADWPCLPIFISWILSFQNDKMSWWALETVKLYIMYKLWPSDTIGLKF